MATDDPREHGQTHPGSVLGPVDLGLALTTVARAETAG